MVREKQINYCCYAIRVGDYLKVGMTGNFFQRMLDHQRDFEIEPEVIFIRKVSTKSIACDVEKYSLVMLNLNNFQRVNGEYFVYENRAKSFLKKVFGVLHKTDFKKAFKVKE